MSGHRSFETLEFGEYLGPTALNLIDARLPIVVGGDAVGFPWRGNRRSPIVDIFPWHVPYHESG